MCNYICFKSCVTNILTTVKSYDELLRKVKIDHYVCKIGLLKKKSKYKNHKRYNRCVRAVCAPCARREHTAASACAL